MFDYMNYESDLIFIWFRTYLVKENTSDVIKHYVNDFVCLFYNVFDRTLVILKDLSVHILTNYHQNSDNLDE